MNHQLAVMLAAITPREALIETLKEAISNYEEAQLLNKSEEEINELFKRLSVHAHLITINVMTKGSFEGVQEMLNRIDELSARDDFFNKAKNVN